jgi:AraC-like DNA-binding protein
MYWVSEICNRGFRDLNPRLFGHEACCAGHTFGSVVRDFWMLFYVDSGRGILISDDRQYPACAGQIFVIRPGARTTLMADQEDPWSYHWIGFDGIFGDRFWQLSICFDFPTDIFTVMERVERYSSCKEEYLVSQLSLLMCQLFDPKEETGHVARARELLNLHYMDDYPIEEIARQIGLDRRYLSRLFAKETGITMQRYRLEVRMRHAQALLGQGYTCAQTAEMTGYSDGTSFSRSYKRFYGFPPSKK